VSYPSSPLPQAAAPEASAFDRDNPFLQEIPAQCVTDVVQTPGGQRMVLTIRTPGTTVTVFLMRDDAEKWRDQISATIARMNGLIVPGG
jgi:hypothetical protein